MAVFRVEKTKDYTVMSNYHLKDKTITLKAKGLLSMMLSLPDDWNYTTRGLARICKEGVDAIGTILRELEKAGYIVRHQTRDRNGRMAETEYVIYERPQPNTDSPCSEEPYTESPCTENPYTVNPYTDKPDTEEPCTENPAQINTNRLNTNLSSTESINPSLPPLRGSNRSEAMSIQRMDTYRDIIRDNIGYDRLMDDPRYNDTLPEIVELITDTICGSRKSIRIAGAEYPIEAVRSRLLQLNQEHIEFVLDAMQRNTSQIKNMKAYLLTALYNAPLTITSSYQSQANYDAVHRS